MPRRNSPGRTTVTRLALFAVVGWALVALTRRHDDAGAGLDAPVSPPVPRLEPEAARTVDAPRSRPRNRRQRIATSLAFTTLLFAGAAFSAGAGEMLFQAVDADCDAPAAELTAEAAEACDAETANETGETASTESSTDEPTTDEGDPAGTDTATGETDGGAGTDPSDTGEATGEEPGTDEPQPPAEDDGDGEEPAEDDGDAEEPAEEPAEDGDSSHESSSSGGDSSNESSSGGGDEAPGSQDDGAKNTSDEPAGEPILELDDEHAEEHGHELELDPEASAPPSVATVWLHRTLPDPTLVARRLAPAFAKQLTAVSKRTGVEWSIVLAAIRAQGHMSRWPAGRTELRDTAKQLRSALASAGEWEAFLALTGRTAYADRATALMDYNRAVGLRALVTGLQAAKPKLERQVLADSRLDIYRGGRADIQGGRIDVRVLVLLRYLAERYEQVTVSSLDTGHGLYARPGAVSAHKYGLAVDIAVLGGQSILGNSAPGGVTEQAVRDILLLPSKLRPKQVISLLGLGGPSFPMGDHADHIHVGY